MTAQMEAVILERDTLAARVAELETLLADCTCRVSAGTR